MSHNPTVDDANQCMKCGFCMYNCPIYKVDHIESHVARGRNMLIRQASDKNLLQIVTTQNVYPIVCYADAVRQFALLSTVS